jgi:Leucine-rich repeat (LRR) protein
MAIFIKFVNEDKIKFNVFKEIINLNNYDDIIYIQCEFMQLTKLPILPKNLKELYCSYNKLTKLPILPKKLEVLYCTCNKINILENILPNSLILLQCGHNKLTKLPILPKNLKILNCSFNLLNILEYELPNTLEYFNCSNNQLTKLSILPNTITTFYCSNNQLTELPILPNIKFYWYINNPIDHFIKKYFDNNHQKYSDWKIKTNIKFANKIGTWFLECKYNPKYKYCKLFQIKSLYKIGAIDKDELDKYIKIDI